MLGPVLTQELLLGSRRGRQLIFRRIYAAGLILQLLAFYWLYLVQSNWLGAKLFGGTIEPQAAADFGTRFTTVLIVQQLLLLLLAAPAYTAGAITDEKMRGTLQYLLAADLTAWEIILGKLLGRVAQVAMLALAALPLFCFLGVFGGLSVPTLLVLILVILMPLFALGSAGLLASVWCRQTRDAVLAVYLLVLGSACLLWTSGYGTPFDPLHVLEPAWGSQGNLAEASRRLLGSMLAWGSVSLLCLGLAMWRLRPAYLRQLEGEGRAKPRRWWRSRPTLVSQEPIRWKERYLEGLAPLATLRRIPAWLGVVLILVTTLVSSTLILWIHVREPLGFAEFVGKLALLRFEQLPGFGPGVESALNQQGLIALLVAGLLIGLRCSGSVTGERERQTWEALLLTPLPAEELIRGKLWGILGASLPYLVAYAAPALPLAFVAGGKAFFLTLLMLVVTVLAMAFLGAAGLWCSVRARSSWRSLLGTVLMGYGGGFCLLMIAFPVAGIVYFVVWATLAIFDLLSGSQTTLAAAWQKAFGLYWVCVSLMSAVGFVLMTWWLLADAQKFVADHERIRHWKDPPRDRSRRPTAPSRRPDRLHEVR